MLKALSQLLERTLRDTPAESGTEREHAIKVATAALMIEVMRADYEEDAAESAAVTDLLQRFFTLNEEEVTLLLESAQDQAERAASLQGFTRLLHEALSVEEKHAVVEMLWSVALADERLDKHEDHLIRKVAGLLYVSHGDLIRLRNRVLERRQ
jgi:uncharacterized tellurite resistance protein B-like protein